MARNKEPNERFGELLPDYEAARQNYMLKAGMLANVVSTVLTLDSRAKEAGFGPMENTFREKLQKALDEFMAA
jgi:hypothetical protein